MNYSKYKITSVEVGQLAECCETIRTSFATVAAEFGLTEQNCPHHTSFIKLETLCERFDEGIPMFAMLDGSRIVGYFSLYEGEDGAYDLINLAVLPEYRHQGRGDALLEYAKSEVIRRGGIKINIGIIEESIRLKNWYAAHGFVHTGTQKFPHLPFTVGFMEFDCL